MTTLIESLRQIIGSPDFYIENGNYSGSWDYGAMIEYIGCILIVIVVVASVFRFITRIAGR